MILRNPNREVPTVPPCDNPLCRCAEYRQRRAAQCIFAEEVVSTDLGEPVTLSEDVARHWYNEAEFWEYMDSTLVTMTMLQGLEEVLKSELEEFFSGSGSDDLDSCDPVN